MKKILFLKFSLILLVCSNLTSAQNPKEKIEAYYFHNTGRCITCKAVENEAKKDLESIYGTRVVFKSVNLEDAANKELVKKFEIAGQTLLVVSGEKRLNLTNEGFMFARTNPEKLKTIIKEKVDKLIAF